MPDAKEGTTLRQRSGISENWHLASPPSTQQPVYDLGLSNPTSIGQPAVSMNLLTSSQACEASVIFKKVWPDLAARDKNTLRKIDQAIVNALELRAPRASTLDAKAREYPIAGIGDRCILLSHGESRTNPMVKRWQVLYSFFEHVADNTNKDYWPGCRVVGDSFNMQDSPNTLLIFPTALMQLL
jgi:hypothetical protein